jgi:hypothetical protein
MSVEPALKKADFKRRVDIWFEKSVWYKPARMRSHTCSPLRIRIEEFYYNCDGSINYTTQILADFAEVLVHEGVICTLNTSFDSFNRCYSYKMDMIMIMDKAIDNDLLSAISI